MPVHVDPGALRKALRETMLIAIRAAPGGQVLVTALTLGSQLHIRITDDGLGADQRDREMLTRSAEASIALQGGSIAVEVRPGHGTMVTVRLPLPGKAGEDVYVLKQLPVLAAQAA
jgi:signal transduction histidine kinase